MSMNRDKTLKTITPAIRNHFAKALDKRYVSDKVIRTLTLVNNGVDIAQAIFLATGNTNPSHDTICRIKRESEITLLTSDKLNLLATSTYEKAMLGIPVVHEYIAGQDEEGVDIKAINIMSPKFTHALNAADAVKARTEPIKAQALARESKTYIQVNLNDYNSKELA